MELGLENENEYVIVDNGCAIHQTSDWQVVDWQELNPDDIRYLYSLAEQSQVQLTLFDEEHYFVVGEKASKIVTDDAALVLRLLLKSALRKLAAASIECFKLCF